MRLSAGTHRCTTAIMAMVFAALMLTACHTTAGVGEDLSAAGKAVTKSADKVKQGL